MTMNQELPEHIVKRTWLEALQCRTQAWYSLRCGTIAMPEAATFRAKQGREVGLHAQRCFPGGQAVRESEPASALRQTSGLISRADVTSIFEGRLEANGCVARADILERLDEGWHVLEVKSSFADTKSLDDLTDDLAYTVMIAQDAGLTVSRASLMLLSRGYRHGLPSDRLFELVDLTDEAVSRAAAYRDSVASVLSELMGDDRPTPVLKSACRSCPFFESECLGHGLDHTVLEIPGLHHTKLKKLASMSVVSLSELPGDMGLTETQARARSAATTGRIQLAGGLAEQLSRFEWPCRYLDFETVATMLPLYPGHGCHQQVLTQFSVHSRDERGARVEHAEYLADPSRDCQREIAENLIQVLGESGSVVVYSDFENQRLKALAEEFSDLAPALEAIQNRLVDLLPVVKQHVYHPAFGGSFSIKAVLPALVPDLDYSGLEISGGDTAITRFAQMARGEITGDEMEQAKRALLAYCKTDTLAMVRLHDALLSLVK